MNIILSDLDKHLFPDRYPYFNSHFDECTEYLKQADKTEIGLLNVSFIMKLTKYSLSIKKEEHRILCSMLFDKIVEHYYEWNKPYNWQDLKLLLLYFMFFSKAKSLKEIKHYFSAKSYAAMFNKYKPPQSKQVSEL